MDDAGSGKEEPANRRTRTSKEAIADTCLEGKSGLNPGAVARRKGRDLGVTLNVTLNTAEAPAGFHIAYVFQERRGRS
jgi:hypothetical protein